MKFEIYAKYAVDASCIQYEIFAKYALYALYTEYEKYEKYATSQFTVCPMCTKPTLFHKIMFLAWRPGSLSKQHQ